MIIQGNVTLGYKEKKRVSIKLFPCSLVFVTEFRRMKSEFSSCQTCINRMWVVNNI